MLLLAPCCPFLSVCADIDFARPPPRVAVLLYAGAHVHICICRSSLKHISHENESGRMNGCRINLRPWMHLFVSRCPPLSLMVGSFPSIEFDEIKRHASVHDHAPASHGGIGVHLEPTSHTPPHMKAKVAR